MPNESILAYLTYEVCVYLAIKESSQVARVLESEETARWFRACLPWLLCGMCDPSQPVQILAGFCRGLLGTMLGTMFRRAGASAA